MHIKGRTAMIVEDEIIPALQLKHELEDMGCRVLDIVKTGETAVQTAMEARPDVIIMDIRLKGKMDGIEAAMKIQETLDIPIVYITAYSDDETVNRARQTRICWMLQKPSFFETIRSTIDEAIGAG